MEEGIPENGGYPRGDKKGELREEAGLISLSVAGYEIDRLSDGSFTRAGMQGQIDDLAAGFFSLRT